MSEKVTPEKKVYEITFAHLENVDEKINANKDIDIYELNDIKLSLKTFELLFYDNKYNYLKINDQFRHSNNFCIKNKMLKHSAHRNYHSNIKFNLVNVLINTYLDNKKKKINDITTLYLTKETEKYNSILDFNILESYLTFNDIFDIYSENNKHNDKKYLRLKMVIHYHSLILDESINIGCNYLVKIPKKYRLNKDEGDESDCESDESDDESDHESDDDNIVYSNYNNKFDQSKNEKKDNIVYSNYNNKLNNNDCNIIFNIDNSEINNEDTMPDILCDSDDDTSCSHFSSNWWSDKKKA
jgi:hypothetical protein